MTISEPAVRSAPGRDAHAFAVTVVVPAYQSARWIGATLAAIAAQTLPPRAVIVVDDGSTDGTGAIAREAGATVLRRANRGASAARNAAIRLAGTPWVAFCDADDVWEPGYLARHVEAAAAAPEAAFVFSDADAFDAHGVVERGLTSNDPAYRALHGEEIAPRVRRFDGPRFGSALYRCDFVMPSSVLARRDALLEAGLFDEGLRVCEDYDLFLRLALRGPVLFVDEPLVRMRKHDANTSGDAVANARWHAAFRERIAAAPARYPAGAEAFLAFDRAASAATAARYALYHGRFAEARAALRELFAVRPSPAALLMYGAALSFDTPPGRRAHRALMRAHAARKRARRHDGSTLEDRR